MSEQVEARGHTDTGSGESALVSPGRVPLVKQPAGLGGEDPRLVALP